MECIKFDGYECEKSYCFVVTCPNIKNSKGKVEEK